MPQRHVPRHPFEGESVLLAGTRDVLGDHYREAIEANHRWEQKQKELATRKILGPGYERDDGAWLKEAACKGAPDPEIFFPVSDEAKKLREWEGYCPGCPVRAACLDFGQRTRSEGIWGGVYLPGKGRSLSLRGWVRGRPRKDRSVAAGAS